MLAAFVHFSPKDGNPKLLSGNWLIQDVTVDRVDNFYNYNYENGLWQTGQPVTSIRFENIKATELLNAFAINGDLKRQLEPGNFTNGSFPLPSKYFAGALPLLSLGNPSFAHCKKPSRTTGDLGTERG